MARHTGRSRHRWSCPRRCGYKATGDPSPACRVTSERRSRCHRFCMSDCISRSLVRSGSAGAPPATSGTSSPRDGARRSAGTPRTTSRCGSSAKARHRSVCPARRPRHSGRDRETGDREADRGSPGLADVRDSGGEAIGLLVGVRATGGGPAGPSRRSAMPAGCAPQPPPPGGVRIRGQVAARAVDQPLFDPTKAVKVPRRALRHGGAGRDRSESGPAVLEPAPASHLLPPHALLLRSASVGRSESTVRPAC